MSPTSTSDHVVPPTPAQAGVASLIGQFALDLLLYAALVVVIGFALVFAAMHAGGLKPRFTGLHWVHVELSPCPVQDGQTEALLERLRRHGVVTPDFTRRGSEMPLELIGRPGPGGTPLQSIFLRLEPAPGEPLSLSETEIAEATGCPVGKLAYGVVGEPGPERLRMPAAMVAIALVGSVLAAALAWAWRRPGRGLRLARGSAGAAIVVAVLAALAAQSLPHLMTAVGAPLSPSNAADLDGLFAARPVLAGVLVVLAAPLAEEAFFRGVLLRRLWLAGRPGLGLALTSALFAVAHELFADGPWWQTLATTGVYASVGLLFGAVYLRTGRLWAAVLAHAASNALALAWLAYSTA